MLPLLIKGALTETLEAENHIDQLLEYVRCYEWSETKDRTPGMADNKEARTRGGGNLWLEIPQPMMANNVVDWLTAHHMTGAEYVKLHGAGNVSCPIEQT